MKTAGLMLLSAVLLAAIATPNPGAADKQAATAKYESPASGQQDAAPVANPVSTTVKSQMARFSKNMVAAAEAMPADKYSFKPTSDMNTYGHLMMHITQTNYFLCSKISGTAAPETTPTDTDPKDKLVAGMKASFDFCATALANIDDSKLSDPDTVWQQAVFSCWRADRP